MPLLDQVTADLTVAMKARDSTTTSALRMLKAALANAEIDARGKGKVCDDTAALTVVRAHAKKLAEAMDEYERGGRSDLVTSARAELAIVVRYLPAAMPEEEVRAVVTAVRQRTGATQVGPLTGAVMRELAGRVDGAVVRRIVEEVLS